MSILKSKAPTKEIARALLGRLLVHQSESGVLAGWIVETEAYVGVEDQACHSYAGRRTPRLEAMYQQAGTIYTYQMHTHTLFNIVCQEEEVPEAVLIRAIEPACGKEQMVKNRQRHGFELSNGPGKLTQAMAISMEVNQKSIFDKKLYIAKDQFQRPGQIEVTPRIGIPNKGKWTQAPLRFTVKGNPYVSKSKKSIMNLETYGWLKG